MTDKTNEGICPYLKEHQQNNLIDKDTKAEAVVETKKCLFVSLKKDASYLNLSAFYLVQFSYVCFFSFMDSMQPHLLDPKENYLDDGLKTSDEIDAVNYDLVFWDNLYLTVFICIFGSFHDVFGRKMVCFFGFLLIGISMICYPFARVVYPNLLLLRLVFSNGICAVTTQPLMADYVSHETKGFAGGIVAFLAGCGALFSVFGLMQLYKSSIVTMGTLYIITGCFSLFVAFYCLFAVKNVETKTYNTCIQRWYNFYIVQIFFRS